MSDFVNLNTYSTEGGFIKLHRSVFEHFIGKDSAYFHVWFYCLAQANFKSRQIRINGGVFPMSIGWFKSSIRLISVATGVERNRVDRILKYFIDKGLMGRRGDVRNAIYEIIDYERYV